MGYVGGAGCCVGDYYTTKYAKPILDTTQDTTYLSSVQSSHFTSFKPPSIAFLPTYLPLTDGSTLTIEWDRPITTTDTTYDYSFTEGNMKVIFAANSHTKPTDQTTFAKHDYTTDGEIFTINFWEASTCNSEANHVPVTVRLDTKIEVFSVTQFRTDIAAYMNVNPSRIIINSVTGPLFPN